MRDHGCAADDDVDHCDPGGCGRCLQTGYRGRIGLFEVLVLDEPLRQLVLERAGADVIARAAVARGMRRSRDDGLDKIRAGVTSPAEVARVTTAA